MVASCTKSSAALGFGFKLFNSGERFRAIMALLCHSGTPNCAKQGVLDVCFKIPSENPDQSLADPTYTCRRLARDCSGDYDQKSVLCFLFFL